MKFRFISTGLLTVVASSLFGSILAAQTFSGGVTQDALGMPTCLESSDAKKYVQFEWSKDLYSRTIFATLHKLDGSYNANCRVSERSYSKQKKADSKHLAVSSSTTDVYGVALPAEVRVALAQAANGANKFRSSDEATPEQFIARHPISNFTVELNRELTAQYGVGFVSEVYRAWIEQDPINKSFKKLILAHVKDEQEKAISRTVGERLKDYTLVMVYGYGHSLNGNQRYTDFKRDLISFGLDLRILETDPFGDIAENSIKIRDQLNALLREGRHVIVLAASKGGTEALGAVSDIARANEKTSGRVEAVVNLSGVVDGSFLVDWATSGIQWLFVKKALFKEFNSEGGKLKSPSEINTLKTMGTTYEKNFFEAHPIALATYPIYLNIVGVKGGDGVSDDPAIRRLQSEAVRPRIKQGFGANDGYVEYPGTQIMGSTGLRTYTVAFESSHPILDGNLEGLSMKETPTRQLVFKGMLQSLADLFESR